MNLIELIIFIAVVVIFSAMSTLIVFLAMRVNRVRKDLVQSEVDKFIFMTQLDKMLQEQDTKSIEGSDGFLKFVSESRDWAFEYIENVQTALREYDEALHTDDAKKLNESYKKLVDFLPKEEDNAI